MLQRAYHQVSFSPDRYRQVLAAIEAQAGETCLRMRETPVFVSRSFSDELVRTAKEIIAESLSLKGVLDAALPPEFNMPSAPDRPSFFIIDFAVTKDGPRLIELQAFASNLLFTPMAAEVYRDVYGLGSHAHLLSEKAEAAIRETILGGHAPENVVLMEINPWQQSSRRDFVLTQKRFGIPVVDVTEVIRKGNQLFYRNERGEEVRIHRIYNRVIASEFQSLGLADKTAFQFSDALDVEWAGDPSWFMRISKYAMPHLKHPAVPETHFFDELTEYPADLENYVLKPVFFNAGIGVKLNVTKADLDDIPAAERLNYILMRKVEFMPFVPDGDGNLLNAEIRVMFVWPDRLTPVAMSARVMRGNDVNADLRGSAPWCGMAPVFVVDNDNASD